MSYNQSNSWYTSYEYNRLQVYIEILCMVCNDTVKVVCHKTAGVYNNLHNQAHMC